MMLLTLEVLTQGLREEVVAGHHTHEHRDVGRETRLSPESEPTHRRATARAPRMTRGADPLALTHEPSNAHVECSSDISDVARHPKAWPLRNSRQYFVVTLTRRAFPHNVTSRAPLALAFATRTRLSRRSGRDASPLDLYGRLHARDLESFVPHVARRLTRCPPRVKESTRLSGLPEFLRQALHRRRVQHAEGRGWIIPLS